jgi:hypothetical protein
VTPPGGNGTIKVIGLTGYAFELCAKAKLAIKVKAKNTEIAWINFFIVIDLYCSHLSARK